jgi:hypothetical protein
MRVLISRGAWASIRIRVWARVRAWSRTRAWVRARALGRIRVWILVRASFTFFSVSLIRICIKPLIFIVVQLVAWILKENSCRIGSRIGCFIYGL